MRNPPAEVSELIGIWMEISWIITLTKEKILVRCRPVPFVHVGRRLGRRGVATLKSGGRIG